MTVSHSKRAITVVLLAVLVIGTASMPVTGTTQDETSHSERIRTAHMSPGVPPVDVLVDDTLVAENVSFSEVSDYQPLPSGEHRLVIRTANGNEEVFNRSGTVPSNETFTFLITGTFTDNETVDLEPKLLIDDISAPGANNTSVRLVHASPDAEAVDVTLHNGRTVLFDNVSFRHDSDYAIGQAGNYTLEIREEDADNDGDVIETYNVSLEAQTVTTVFLSGVAEPDDAPVTTPLGLTSVTDASDDGAKTAQVVEANP